MFSRFTLVAALAIFCCSFANSTDNKKCVVKGDKTYCGSTPFLNQPNKCPYDFSGSGRKVLTASEVQKCLDKVPLYCTGKIIVGQEASVYFSSTQGGFNNAGSMEAGLFAIGKKSQVYKSVSTEGAGLNACVKADKWGRVYFTYGQESSGSMCYERAGDKPTVRCVIEKQNEVTDFSACLADIYKDCRKAGGRGDHDPAKGGNSGKEVGRGDNGGDGGNDNGNDGGNDNGNDGGNDNGNDGGNDNGNDGGNDGGNDNGNDGGNDGGNDNGNDGGNDGGNDNGNDGGNDGGNNGNGNDNGNDGGNDGGNNGNGHGNNGGGNGGDDGKANDNGGGNDGNDGDDGGEGHGNGKDGKGKGHGGSGKGQNRDSNKRSGR